MKMFRDYGNLLNLQEKYLAQPMKSEPISSWSTALRLEYFTVAYNVIEAIVSIIFGSVASSIALVGFGLDSIVESLSGLILIWRLHQHEDCSHEEEKRKNCTTISCSHFLYSRYIRPL